MSRLPRRRILAPSSLALLALAAAGVATPAPAGTTRRPNVLLIMSDDQGYGDLGRHGNPVLRTPNLDALAAGSTEIATFYVSPVCAPTRASLMTGRYNYRTRVTDTYLGRAMMDPGEVTLAEMLGAAGYRTGIFGKWHLGDDYPLRPQDQGFQDVLVHRGGGIAQPSDPPEPGASSYVDPILQHNGRREKARGYCSDVFTEAAIRFMAEDRERPFFAYLAFNAPHTPLQVSDRDRGRFKDADLSASSLPKVGRPVEGAIDADATARVYEMVANLDDNVGRLLGKLDELGLAEETIVVFLTDNGPQQPRYNAGLRGRKGTVYEGGIRVPFFVRWPGRIPAGRTLDLVAAHVDVAPTLLDACGVPKPEGVSFDGRSLLGPLRGDHARWPDRTLFFQWHRGDVPELNRAFAARDATWKLVQPLGNGEAPGPVHFELYSIKDDPYELHDVSGSHPDVVKRLRSEYEAWFRDVCSTRGFDPPRIVLGTSHQDPTLLTRQDWRGPRAGWMPKSLGHWEVEIGEPGTYRVTLRFAPPPEGGTARLSIGSLRREASIAPGAVFQIFDGVELPAGPARLEGSVVPQAGGEPSGVEYVEVGRISGR